MWVANVMRALTLSVIATSAAPALPGPVAAAMLPPTLDDFWDGKATFAMHRSFPLHDPGLPGVNAGTRIVVANGAW